MLQGKKKMSAVSVKGQQQRKMIAVHYSHNNNIKYKWVTI